MATTTPDGLYKPESTTMIAPLETVLSTMQDSVQTALTTRAVRTYKPADLNALAAIVGMSANDLAVVGEGGAIFEYISGWVQITPARFATTAARDTAYAKASAGYRVAGASVHRTDTGWKEEWQTTATAGVAGWLPVSGAKPSGSAIRTTDLAGGVSASLSAAVFDSAPVQRGVTWSSGQPTRLTATVRGRYHLVGTASIGSTANGVAQLRINGSISRAPLTQPNASGAAVITVSDVVTLAAGDYVELMVQSSGTFTLFQSTTLSAEYINVR